MYFALLSPDCRAVTLTNRPSENVAQFRYLGTTGSNENLIQKEIKKSLNSGNACNHSVQNLLSSRLLSNNLKIRIYTKIILPAFLYGSEPCSLTLRYEHRLRIFDSRALYRRYMN
jgi:hypothetical protein